MGTEGPLNEALASQEGKAIFKIADRLEKGGHKLYSKDAAPWLYYGA